MDAKSITPNPRKQKILHGNGARVDPHAEVVSAFLTQAITSVDHFDNVTPMVSDIDVVRARDWSIENKK